MKLYMVRHGQSETNLEGRYTGWAQVNLTEQGVADAKRAGEYLRGIPFDRVYASDLIRALQTAQHAMPGCQPVQLPVLREINVGELERQLVAECPKRYGQDFDEHRRARNFVPYGGENQELFRERVCQFMRMMEEENAETVVAFAHAGVVQTMLDVVLGMEVDRSRVRCLNGSVSVFEYDGSRWRLLTWGAAVR